MLKPIKEIFELIYVTNIFLNKFLSTDMPYYYVLLLTLRVKGKIYSYSLGRTITKIIKH